MVKCVDRQMKVDNDSILAAAYSKWFGVWAVVPMSRKFRILQDVVWARRQENLSSWQCFLPSCCCAVPYWKLQSDSAPVVVPKVAVPLDSRRQLGQSYRPSYKPQRSTWLIPFRAILKVQWYVSVFAAPNLYSVLENFQIILIHRKDEGGHISDVSASRECGRGT